MYVSLLPPRGSPPTLQTQAARPIHSIIYLSIYFQFLLQHEADFTGGNRRYLCRFLISIETIHQGCGCRTGSAVWLDWNSLLHHRCEVSRAEPRVSPWKLHPGSCKYKQNRPHGCFSQWEQTSDSRSRRRNRSYLVAAELWLLFLVLVTRGFGFYSSAHDLQMYRFILWKWYKKIN